MKDKWQTLALMLAALLLGGILGRQGLFPGAEAQGESAAGRVAVVVGPERNGYAPIVLVDSLEQSIMVYEYSYAGRRIELESARTYRFDKQLMEFKTGEPSVRQVQDMVQRRGP